MILGGYKRVIAAISLEAVPIKHYANQHISAFETHEYTLRMSKIDQRGLLERDPFGYRISKDGAVFLEFEGRVVKTLAGPTAKKFVARVAVLEGLELPLVLAKLTGNFKRGNER